MFSCCRLLFQELKMTSLFLSYCTFHSQGITSHLAEQILENSSHMKWTNTPIFTSLIHQLGLHSYMFPYWGNMLGSNNVSARCGNYPEYLTHLDLPFSYFLSSILTAILKDFFHFVFTRTALASEKSNSTDLKGPIGPFNNN